VNIFVVAAFCALLITLLSFLQIWQKKVDEVRRSRAAAEIREAEETGTGKAIAQHPQINVQTCIGCGLCIAACPEDGVLGLVDGVTRVIHGSRCVGHGLCAEVCPVGAIEISLGDISERNDIPILSSHLESSVPGLYLAGELGGLGLIRIAVEQGVRAVERIAAELKRAPPSGLDPKVADLLIVGAGPAGFAAALKAIEKRVRYIAIDQDDIGGTVRKYPRRKLTLTGPLDLPLYGRVKKTEFLKEELIVFWEKLVADYGLKIRSGVKLTGIERRGDVFFAQTSAGSAVARRVILALGRRGSPRKLGVPGEDHEKVLYHLIDAATYKNESILVVGGGDSAVEAATALANQPGNAVTVSYRKDRFFRLRKRNEERIRKYSAEGKVRVIFNSAVKAIEPDSVVLSVRTEGAEKRTALRNSYVFVCIGGDPPYELLRQAGVRFNGDDPSPEVSRRATAGNPMESEAAS